MTTVEQLTQIFNDNFIAYLRSHIAHVNIMGRNFASDHQLLGGIYEDLQGQIDHIGELLRTLDAFMPASIFEITDGTHIPLTAVEGSADTLLSDVLDDLEHLVECYKELEEVAEDEDLEHISNYAQDRVLAISKQIWMLKATLEV
jgi:DNA-binding ferritin-like protein